jgi:hypothetical protein
LEAVGRHRLFVVMGYNPGSVADGFDCKEHVRNIRR